MENMYIKQEKYLLSASNHTSRLGRDSQFISILIQPFQSTTKMVLYVAAMNLTKCFALRMDGRKLISGQINDADPKFEDD